VEMDARLNITAGNPPQSSEVTVRLLYGRASVTELKLAVPADSPTPNVEFAFKNVFEARLSLSALGALGSAPVRFQFSLWQGGLPMDAVPQQGWIEMPAADQADGAG
jgi:hypothetical protein